MSSALRRVILSAAERDPSSVAEQHLMSSALRHAILSTAKRGPSSAVEPQLMSFALRCAILYCRAGCAMGRWAPIDVVRSATRNTVLQSGVCHRSLSSNWCRSLYDTQFSINAGLLAVQRVSSLVSVTASKFANAMRGLL